jgi:hypothetical protein
MRCYSSSKAAPHERRLILLQLFTEYTLRNRSLAQFAVPFDLSLIHILNSC